MPSSSRRERDADDSSSEKEERKSRRRHRMPDGDAGKGKDADAGHSLHCSGGIALSQSMSDVEDSAPDAKPQGHAPASSSGKHRQTSSAKQAPQQGEKAGTKRAADGRDGPGSEAPHAKSPKRRHGQSPGQATSPERHDDGNLSSTEDASFETWRPSSPRKGRIQSMLLGASSPRRSSAGLAMQIAPADHTASTAGTSGTSDINTQPDGRHSADSAPASPRRARTSAVQGRDRTYAISSQPRPLSPRLLSKGADKALPREKEGRADVLINPPKASMANALPAEQGASQWDRSDVELAEISLALLAQAGPSGPHDADSQSDANAAPLTIRPDVLNDLEALLAQAEQELGQARDSGIKES
jgi:hypothetical protein